MTRSCMTCAWWRRSFTDVDSERCVRCLPGYREWTADDYLKVTGKRAGRAESRGRIMWIWKRKRKGA